MNNSKKPLDENILQLLQMKILGMEIKNARTGKMRDGEVIKKIKEAIENEVEREEP